METIMSEFLTIYAEYTLYACHIMIGFWIAMFLLDLPNLGGFCLEHECYKLEGERERKDLSVLKRVQAAVKNTVSPLPPAQKEEVDTLEEHRALVLAQLDMLESLFADREACNPKNVQTNMILDVNDTVVAGAMIRDGLFYGNTQVEYEPENTVTLSPYTRCETYVDYVPPLMTGRDDETIEGLLSLFAEASDGEIEALAFSTPNPQEGITREQEEARNLDLNEIFNISL